MRDEISYTKHTDPGHIKKLGQYFTNFHAAEFMCAWACDGADTMLDPAAGNSIFLILAKKYRPQCSLTGYEIDSKILHWFGNPAQADLVHADYLMNGWEEKFDAIVCNPPYNRFQAVDNRDQILESIFSHTGVQYSGYTNLYILFLIKSIYQLSEKGRLAYMIPLEFMNSKFGTSVKQLLIDQQLLRAIISFEQDGELFFNATTTCCILLLDREPKNCADFYSLSAVDELGLDIFQRPPDIRVPYIQLRAEEKWRLYIRQECLSEHTNLRPISDCCSVTRGIATGANDFFCFSRSKAEAFGIPERCLKRCICRSADVTSPVFSATDFSQLSAQDRTVYLLDVAAEEYLSIRLYLEHGEAEGVNKRYLVSHRDPWYSMEQKRTAPIWVSSACRKGIKFVRNLAMAKSLTTFHSVFVREEYQEDTDLIFCYFLTPAAQHIIRENRKELGNGLDKFQPNDFNTAKMLDPGVITPRDRAAVLDLYRQIAVRPASEHIAQLNDIFSAYLA